MSLPEIPVIRGLREIAAEYDALIVDLWGVVHGGTAPYPGALETLGALRTAGKPVGLLSNAPRRASTAVRRLTEIGVPPDAYDVLMTSGEATHEALAAREDAAHAALGRHFFYIGPPWDSDLVADLDYRAVETVEKADFMLCVGLFDEAEPLFHYNELLGWAGARGRAMICVNPDLVVHRQSGVTSPCAGLLAKHYRESFDGRVIYHGKPEPKIFRRCARALGTTEGARVLVVGDSLTTDIEGARAAGYDSLFVTRGIFAEELGIAPGEEPDPAKVAALCARYGERPIAAIATLRW
jgi:HAD superfamily hydrolase (TIGR01459 family)